MRFRVSVVRSDSDSVSVPIRPGCVRCYVRSEPCSVRRNALSYYSNVLASCSSIVAMHLFPNGDALCYYERPCYERPSTPSIRAVRLRKDGRLRFRRFRPTYGTAV